MAVLKKEELLAKVKEVIGDSTDDKVLSLFDDVSDTIVDLESKTKEDTTWKEKYEKNDAEWRKRYRDRFFGKAPENEEPDIPDEEEHKETKPLRFEDLFKEEQ